MGNITDIEFTDDTWYSHGLYRFYLTMDDEYYSGTINMQPIGNRMPDEVSWYGDTPDGWEEIEPIILGKLFTFIHNQNQN